MNDVSINDIIEIEKELNVSLTEEQRSQILKEYQRIVRDKAESWDKIIKQLILNLFS
jgi:hypothetical protein